MSESPGFTPGPTPGPLAIAEPLRSLLPSLRERFRREGWWGDTTFASRAAELAREDADRPVLGDDVETMTRRELAERAAWLATELAAAGVPHGSVVGLQMANSAKYAVANLACELAGLVWVNLSRAYGRHEMTEILGHLGATALLTSEAAAADALRDELPALQVLVAVDAPAPAGWLSYDALVTGPADPAVIASRHLTADDVYSIALSSGTTSARPKEAMRSVNSMYSALSIMNDDLGVGGDDRILVLAPQTGGTGYSYSVAFPMITGARADVTELPVGEELVARIRELRPSVLVAVPTQMARLLDAAGGDRAMWSELRLIINSGAPLLGEVAARAEEECGCPIVSVYGATDGLVPVMASPDEPPEVRHASVGRVIAGHAMRIVDDDGRELPPGETGEILGFGPGMAFGYVDNPAEMAREWDTDGWWHSGDLGVLDATGHLRVVGRKKEMILRGGVNISPLEIEELLGRHPDVAEVAVVPIEHPDLLEQACAVVVPRAGATPTLDDLCAFLRGEGLAKFKLPEHLVLRDELPRTAAQKIDKLTLVREVNEVDQGAGE